MKIVLKVEKVYKKFDGVKALDNFSLTLKRNEILGLIGPNGAGKSTLFNIITGFVKCDSGLAYFHKESILDKSPIEIARLGISRIFQRLRLVYQMSVLENVMLSFRNQPGENVLSIFFRKDKVFNKEKELRKKAIGLLEFAGLTENSYELAINLSYGQQKLLSLICCIASAGELFLLDEPVAGINPGMITKILSIISELSNNGKSIILIDHNIDAVTKVCNRVIFMDQGKKICEGSPKYVKNNKKVLEAYLKFNKNNVTN